MNEIFDKILAWFDNRFEDGESEDWYHKRIVETVVAQYTTKDELKNELSEFLTSLQQEHPEVNLEREIEKEYYSCATYESGSISGEGYQLEAQGHYECYLSRNEFADIARHFFELGLKARKEETE